MVNFLDAITEIGKATKQTSNEFTILHYISNGYLDVLIKFDSKYKNHFLQVSQLGGDDEYFVLGIENDDQKIYKVGIDSLNLNELLNCFQKINGNIKIASTTGYMRGSSQYVILDKPFKSLDCSTISKDPIELAKVLNSFNLGLGINVLDLLFDLKQIKNIPSPVRKPNTDGIIGHTKKARTIKDIGLWFAKKEIKKNPLITKKELGFNVNILLTKNLPRILEKQSELKIKGHVTIPDPDTIRKWKELKELFAEHKQ